MITKEKRNLWARTLDFSAQVLGDGDGECKETAVREAPHLDRSIALTFFVYQSYGIVCENQT